MLVNLVKKETWLNILWNVAQQPQQPKAYIAMKPKGTGREPMGPKEQETDAEGLTRAKGWTPKALKVSPRDSKQPKELEG